MSHPDVARGPLPRFHASRDVDRLMAMVSALAQEIVVLRDRLDAHERLSGRPGGFPPELVDRFEPSPDAAARRAEERRRIVHAVFRPVLADAPAERDDTPYAAFVGSLEDPQETPR